MEKSPPKLSQVRRTRATSAKENSKSVDEVVDKATVKKVTGKKVSDKVNVEKVADKVVNVEKVGDKVDKVVDNAVKDKVVKVTDKILETNSDNVAQAYKDFLLKSLDGKKVQLSDDEEAMLILMKYLKRVMYFALFLLICFLISFIVNCIYSTKFSSYLASNNMNIMTNEKKDQLALVNNLSVSSWFFNATPILNVALCGAFAYSVDKLKNM